ncbi:MAG: hypothetical protein IT369_14820 [Candidatus Latescibacteria bacterium]|nr:hypothetical protein [Candidatus Latescibacterota bacterium]
MVPALFLLVLHSQYLYPLAPDLALLAALAMALVYVRLPLVHPVLRFLVFAGLSALCYWLAAASCLVGVVFCGLFEGLTKRRLVLGLACLLLGFYLPYLAAVHVCGFGFAKAYGQLLPFYGPFLLGAWLSEIAAVLLCLFVPLAGLGVGCWRIWSHRPSMAGLAATLASWSASRWGQASKVLALLAALVVSAAASFPGDYKVLLQIDYHASRREWPQVLQAAQGVRAYNTLAVYNINRALCHLDRLLGEMFVYPQRKNAEIFLPPPEAPANLRAMSEILLELGQVNIAEHMALEALEIYGDRPSLLRQLVLINVLKQRPRAAHTFLGLLEKNPLHRDWARTYRAALDADSTLAGDAQVQELRALMVVEDYTGYFTAEELLVQALERNPHNLMAFQYLMGHYLLTGKLDKVAAYIGHLNSFPADFSYPEIPRHCEEALLLYAMKARSSGAAPSLPLFGRRIDPQTRERFGDFRAVLARYGGDAEAVRQALAGSYGGTYWFYYFLRGSGQQGEVPSGTTK